ncbi:MAG: diiron oxygenase, partial [Nocardiaceae bacterium]|nr:diiron oxygenase [Nocardiaceae bacterium]
WDSPEFDVNGTTTEWKLPDIDPLAHTDWYRNLSAERRAEVARLRLAAITKCGSQFEQLLLLGGTQFLMGLQNGNPEFRYFMHELTEETHHIQMFQEFTNRACPEATGLRPWLKNVFPLVGMLGTLWPSFFFQIILAGEEPIDHVQKSILRTGGTNPLLDRIMQIHVAEEARHIGFAHAWLERHAPSRSALNRMVIGLATPFLMTIGFWAIMVPSPKDVEAMGIPPEVFGEAYGWNSPLLSRLRSDCAADVRALAIETSLLTPLTRPAWKLAGVEGRPSRYRAEPTRSVA